MVGNLTARLRDENIETLDIAFLSHSHHDHYRGLKDVLEATPAKRFCDGGVDPKQVLDLLKYANRPKDERNDFIKLHEFLDKQISDGDVDYLRLDEGSKPITLRLDEGWRGQIVCLGPDPAVHRALTRTSVSKKRVHGSLNSVSLVLVVWLEGPEVSFNALLAGDAEADGLRRAWQLWKDHAKQVGVREHRLNLMKVSHHGSYTALVPEVFQEARTPDEEALAVISVGERFNALPNREVIRALLDAGWTVTSTCRRVTAASAPTSLAFTLSGKPTSPTFVHQAQEVLYRWSPEQAAEWEPSAAVVLPAEIDLYQAKK